MSAVEEVVALVPAAGFASRFGSDKLLVRYSGRPLAAHIADTLSAMHLRRCIAVCPGGNAARGNLFATRGFEILWNDEPELGLGHSIALGAAQARALGAGALMICLADMPRVTRAHLDRLIEADDGVTALATEVGGVPMPPALFPGTMLPTLSTLTGDRGARALLAEARTIGVEAALGLDIDTVSDLDRS